MTARPLKPVPQAWIDAFYTSPEWQRLSYQAKLHYGRRCQCCGANPEDGAVIQSDHIKPIRYYWELRLDITNIQVLCEGCNRGKGSWDETDHRPRSIGNVLFGVAEIDEGKARLKNTITDQYSEGLLTEDEAIRAIRDSGLVHA